MKRKWDVSQKKVRERCVEEIITRVGEQDGSSFGVIAAEDIIEIVLQAIGPDIYNLGVSDARKIVEGKLSDLQIDLDVLKQEGDYLSPS